MASIIRADTAQLRDVARQMRATATQINAGTSELARAMAALDTTWSGSARERGMARWGEIHPHYLPNAARLEHFARELDGLADRLEEAARVFGDGVRIIPDSHSIQDWLLNSQKTLEATPKNMAQMFDLITKKPDIKLYQVGPNEFAVLLNGTDLKDATGITSLPNAIASGLGQETSYTQQLRTMLATLPPGSDIHMFGYSQGGIVAQNVTADQAFFAQHGLMVKSVSTYGSPSPLKSVPNVDYSRNFDAPGDFVSKLLPPVQMTDGCIKINLESTMTVMMFSGKPNLAGVAVVHGVQVHTQDYGAPEAGSPPSSTRQKMLNDNDLPFKSDQWVEWGEPYTEKSKTWVELGDDVLQTGKAGAAYTISEGARHAVDTYNKAIDGAENIADQGRNVVNDVKSSVVNFTPGPLKGFVKTILN